MEDILLNHLIFDQTKKFQHSNVICHMSLFLIYIKSNE